MGTRLTALIGALATIVAFTGTADAGSRVFWPVTIDPINRTAIGSPAEARAGVGGQYIGCWMAATGTDDQADGVIHAGCWALAATGLPVSCLFPDTSSQVDLFPPLWLNSRDALIRFTWDANNICTGVETWVYANVRPKVH